MKHRQLYGMFLALCILTIIYINPTMSTRADDGINGWDHVPRHVRVSVLMYHYIDHPPADANKVLKDLVVTPENFTEQMQWLSDNGYHNITPDQFMDALWKGDPLPDKPVMITFDDGYANAWYNAFPILRKFNFSGVFFVITDKVDANSPGYLSWDLARQMADNGMFIENHTRGHENLKDRSVEFLTDQIETAQKAIEGHIGRKPRLFAYPFGAYDGRVVTVLHKVGLDAAFTTQGGVYAYAGNIMRIPRIRIRGGMNLNEFIRTVTETFN